MIRTSIHTLSAAVLIAATGASLAGAGAPDHTHGHDASAFGAPGEADKANRTASIDMSDAMRFTPANIGVKQGQTIRFVIKNVGKVKHEFVLGSAKELKEHYELMKRFPEMEHSDANSVTVAPGQTGEVIWHFTKAGKVEFACLQPGHYDAGMKGAVSVAASKMAAPRRVRAEAHSDHPH